MRAAASQVHAFEILESVVRSQMQHLVEAMREVERCTSIDVERFFPIHRRDDSFVTDPAFDIMNADLPELLQSNRAVARNRLRRPLHVRMVVSYRYKHVQRAHARGSE